MSAGLLFIRVFVDKAQVSWTACIAPESVRNSVWYTEVLSTRERSSLGVCMNLKRDATLFDISQTITRMPTSSAGERGEDDSDEELFASEIIVPPLIGHSFSALCAFRGLPPGVTFHLQ